MTKSERYGPIITAQTGWNEACIIGTENDLLDFANSIIQAVKGAKDSEFFGQQAKTSGLIYGKLGCSSEVQFDWLVVTSNDKQTLELAHKVAGL